MGVATTAAVVTAATAATGILFDASICNAKYIARLTRPVILILYMNQLNQKLKLVVETPLTRLPFVLEVWM